MLSVLAALLGAAFSSSAGDFSGDELKVGRMNPAFDHLGAFSEQLDAAIASRCTLVYATGLGAYSYSGLPPKAKLDAYLDHLRDYNRKAHSNGVLVLSYLCATSIVDPEKFATDLGDYFPGRPEAFTPRRMLQQDINGTNLPSWYGGAYTPADMWNPYWREYTKLTIKLVVASDHDGVFFDNPTVHPQGNYSEYAMKAWARFLQDEGTKAATNDLAALRSLTKSQPELWRKFRTTEAADFFREMREYGRSLKPGFILTVNNSLNSWDSFYSQSQDYGYSILEQSRHEDVVTIEDMSSQPRRDGAAFVSYAGPLRMLHAINNGRPLSICTIDGNYTAPAGFMKLAIAECAAHDAAYMVWSCWELAARTALEENVAAYHDFMRKHEKLFVDSRSAPEMLLIWPSENWVRTRDCATASLARELSAANLQYDVVTESDLSAGVLRQYRMVIYATAEPMARKATMEVFGAYKKGGGRVIPLSLKAGATAGTNDVMTVARLQQMLKTPAVTVTGAAGVRAVMRQSNAGAPLLHVYNLDVARKDAYHDTVKPVKDVKITWRLPPEAEAITDLRLLTPDDEATSGEVAFMRIIENGGVKFELVVPELRQWTVVVAK